MEFKVFRQPYKIIERHLDTFGHVNNATYLQIFEEARWEFIAPRGFDLGKIQALQIGPTILECNIRFMRELRLRQDVMILSQILSYEKKISIWRQWIENTEGELCCEAVFTVGLFDLKARKLILPTPEWLYAIGGPRNSAL